MPGSHGWYGHATKHIGGILLCTSISLRTLPPWVGRSSTPIRELESRMARAVSARNKYDCLVLLMRVKRRREVLSRAECRLPQTPTPERMLWDVIRAGGRDGLRVHIPFSSPACENFREMVDFRNRKDSTPPIRVQKRYNSTRWAMRDRLDTTEPYPLTALERAVRTHSPGPGSPG